MTLPADILINTGRIKWPPILSSQGGNGLMASMYGERSEEKQVERPWCVCVHEHFLCARVIGVHVCNHSAY